MKISILSLFPDIFRGFLGASIISRAIAAELICVDLVDIRDFAYDTHKKCDDEVFGGGRGMLLKAEPLGLALESVGAGRSRTVFPSPSGRLFTQNYAADLAQESELVFICGHYEGIDQRIIDSYVDDEISLGDFVISSGEVATLAIIDAVFRLLPGVLHPQSHSEESFSAGLSGLLEYPQYTRPAVYDNLPVPEVLRSGHHAKIVQWRIKESLKKTLAYRPELLTGISPELVALLGKIINEDCDNGPDPHDNNTPIKA